ncbi:MAG TPA: universal stress protein [Thermodesulfovibrio thiophilus]|nr:universal stress protein [Thermodesulfovibrio thiophilus]
MVKFPFEKVLLPVDRSEHSKRAVKFAGKLFSSIENYISNITILHVITGGFLSKHIKNIDFRAESLKDSEFFEKLKNKHYEENIKPFLDEYEQLLRNEGVKLNLNQIILEGDPGNTIIEYALREGFSTVMLSRRGMSPLKSLFLGSVSEKVVYGLVDQNIYLIGNKMAEDCPVSKVLVPVDGSEYSMKAVEHAVYLAKILKKIQEITIFRVINVSLYLERLKQGIDPEEEAKDILIKTKRKFLEEVTENIIKTKINVGFPAEEVVKEIHDGNYNLVVMGRRGRSVLKDLIIGGVSSAVINRCFEPTIAIINL